MAAIAILATLATGCRSEQPPPNIVGPQAVRIRGPIHTDATSIVDATGAAVRFNGVGVRDYVEVGPDAGCVNTPSPREVRDIAGWGFNSVRIPLAWANLEPDPPAKASDGTLTHAWNATYLSNLDGFVDQLTARGVAVFFTIHNKFGSNTDKGACNLSSMPTWMYPQGIDDGAAARCDFLEGVTQPGAPQSVWDGYAAVWAMLAERYADDPQVVGADMVNEPYASGPCGPGDTRLPELYQEVGTAIRHANPDMALIFEDSPPGQALAGKFQMQQPPPFPNVVYSYHLYQPNWDPDGKAVNDAYMARAQAWDVPLLVGEFNAFGYSAPGAGYDDRWAEDAAAALAYWRRNDVGWMAWAYSGGNHLINRDGSPRADLISAFQRGF